MTIRSPIKGRVLSLTSQPGRRLMGINAASERDASTVVTLYDPQQLQVRADVRLEDVPQVQVGQPVQISTAAAKESLAGHVLAMTSQADIQKNTLQVKVAIDQPAVIVRPEMLAQVTFLAPERPDAKPESEQSPLRLARPQGTGRRRVKTVRRSGSPMPPGALRVAEPFSSAARAPTNSSK